MGKNLEPQFAFRCDTITIKKLEYIAEKNTRTRNQEMKHIIKAYINQYEAEHGEIEIKETTREDAVKEFKNTIEKRSKKEIGRGKTVIESVKSGFKFGNAEE